MTTLSRVALIALLLVVLVSASSCAAVAGIFKAGMWVGVLLAVVVVGGVALVFGMFR